MMCSRLFLFRSFHLPSFKLHRTLTLNKFHSISNRCMFKSFIPILTHTRNFWETFPSIRPLYHEKDGLSRDKYELIYHFRIFNYVFWAQLGFFSLIASEIFGGLRYIYKWLFPPDVIESLTYVGPFVMNATSIPSIIAIMLFNIQGIVMIIAAQTSVLRVYYCEETEEYVFVKLGLNPFKSRLLHCYPGELHQLEESPLNFLFGSHKLNHEKLYMRPDNFKSSYLYNNLLFKDYK